MKANEGNAQFIRFEGDVQYIKYQILKEVAEKAFKGTLKDEYKKIPDKVVDRYNSRVRCCIYKEKAVVEEKVKIAMGKNYENKNIVQVVAPACDECPVNRFIVTEACRGCLAKNCKEACSFGAIYHIGKKAYIDSTKCKECGKCKISCPYNAIAEVLRPCMRACNVDALSYDSDTKKAVIDENRCIQCGACIFACPFGAITDKSFITEVISLLNNKRDGINLKIYAVVAPAIASQFPYAKIGQVVNAIKKLGFNDVIEAALGADIVALHETEEFAENVTEKKVVTSSCCPAFVSYIEKNYPNLKRNISTSVSPMIAVSRLIKSIEPRSKVVFIGPCTAKKAEINEEDLKESTDYVLTFEELLAMLDASNININDCDNAILDNASFYGRIFARSGGVTESIKHIVDSQKIAVDFTPVICDGLKQCDMALKLAKIGKLKGNFIEGMACTGGCIAGAASLNHGPKDKSEVDKYGKMAMEKEISESLRVFDVKKIDLNRKFK